MKMKNTAKFFYFILAFTFFTNFSFGYANKESSVLGIDISDSAASRKALKKIKEKILSNKPIVFIALDGGGVRGVTFYPQTA